MAKSGQGHRKYISKQAREGFEILRNFKEEDWNEEGGGSEGYSEVDGEESSEEEGSA